MVVGSYVPPVTALGPVHVPPASGVPPSSAKRLMGASFAHTVALPGKPASGVLTTLTLTTLASFR